MKKTIIRIIKFIAIIFILLLIINLLLLIIPYKDLKEFQNKSYSLRIYDRNNNLLRILPLDDGFKREFTDFYNIPGLVKDIFITSEDKRFYYHFGIDPIALVRSIYLNFKYKDTITGASTISMQLSRIISPHNGEYKGKIKEILNALRIESKLSKKKILELWLNSIPFGQQAIGIESASKTYFGRSIDNISPAQVLALAIIPRSPVRYDPKNHNGFLLMSTINLAKRINYNITSNEIKQGLENTSTFEWPYQTEHFVNFVENNTTTEELASGKDIISSIDLDLNLFIRDRIKYYLDKFKDNRILNGAAIVINNKTGEILAYVGSQDFADKENSGEIDGIHILNQPGSSIKPFLYGLALERGFYPTTILPDIPLDFGGAQVYIPSNFNLRYNGPVRFRVALASSLNVTSVYLITRIGVKNFIKRLKELDFESLKEQEDHLGSGLAIGNAEVSLYEMARAFSVFPRKGQKLLPTWKKTRNDFVYIGKQIYTEYAASMICDILSDDASRALGFGSNSKLNTPFPAIFKTGTSDQFGNIWAFGATPDYTAGVWLGNFSGETVIGRTGSSVPATIVVQILTDLTKNPKDFQLADNIEKVVICPLSGEKATALCTGAIYDYIPKGTELPECTYHFKKNGKIEVKYPPIFSNWISKYDDNDILGFSNMKIDFPKILRPNNGSIFYLDPTISKEEQVVKIEIINKSNSETLKLFLNGTLVKNLFYPYTWLFPMQKGEWEIIVKGKNNKDKVFFTIK